MDRQTRKEIAECRMALREHAEHYYGQDHMTLTDWLKVIVGTIIVVPVMWVTTAILLSL